MFDAHSILSHLMCQCVSLIWVLLLPQAIFFTPQSLATYDALKWLG